MFVFASPSGFALLRSQNSTLGSPTGATRAQTPYRMNSAMFAMNIRANRSGLGVREGGEPGGFIGDGSRPSCRQVRGKGTTATVDAILLGRDINDEGRIRSV